jgi:hypothetical protein
MLIAALLACVVVAALALVVARAGRRDRRPRIPPPRFRAVVIDLLGRLGLDIIEEELRGPERRLVAVRAGPAAGRCLVFVEPAPPGDVVPPPVLDELAENVRNDSGAVGLLVTPYRIGGACNAPVELVDGKKLRQLVAAYLPERLAELDGYFGFNAAAG